MSGLSRALLVAVVAIATTTSVVAVPDARAKHDLWPQKRTASYQMGDVGPMLGGLGCGRGAACFGRTVGDTFAVKVEDDSGRRVGGVVRVTNRGGWTVLYRPFCGTSTRLPSVAGNLTVYLDAPGDIYPAHWFGGPGCTDIRPLGQTPVWTTQGATSGKVHVTFTKRR